MLYFFDTYAIIEILQGNSAYEQYKDMPIVTTMANFGEIYYSLLKGSTEELADESLQKIKFQFIELTQPAVKEAMQFRYKQKIIKLSYIDCFGYITAKQNNMLFLTGDQSFAHFENVEFVK